MIPTLLAVGLLIGLVLATRRVALPVTVGVIAVVWGVGVATGDDASVATGVAGFALALVNLAVGAVIGLGVRALVARGQRSPRHR
ncbi:MAG TPA: hypothetical protein VFN21_02835 [Acidimicrobiales bacterium]|nr:hypothetical protein [Acidimicrobiales bacterium]